MIGEGTTDERPNNGTQTEDSSEHSKQPRSVLKASDLRHDLQHGHEDPRSSKTRYSPTSNKLIDVLADTAYQRPDFEN